MTDERPGGAPAFEQPDFSKFDGSTDDEDDGPDENAPEGSADADELSGDAADTGAAAVADDTVDAGEGWDSAGGDPGAGTHPASANAGLAGTAQTVLAHIAASIVDDKDAVVVEAKEVRGQVRLYLHVSPADMGRIIGRRGRTAQAMRTLVRAAAASEGHDVFVEIVD